MQALTHILNALFPSTCVACGNTLLGNEQHLCVHCLNNLASTHYSPMPNNPTEQMLAGRTPFVSATSMLHYRHSNTVQHIVHSMKFHGNSDLCILMGRLMGLDLLHSQRFDDIDLLIPVPLHPLRHLARGYNQSQLLCQGIAQNMPRPILHTALIRPRYTRKQSLQQNSQRQTNVKDAFKVRHPEKLAGHHILLVDDVLTTGATLVSCCQALAHIPNLRISIATLSIAGL